MALTQLSSSEVRARIASVLTRLRKTKRPVYITRHGKAEAVLLSIERYNALMDLLEDREDELDVALGRRLQEERQAYASGAGRDFEDFAAGLESAHVSN